MHFDVTESNFGGVPRVKMVPIAPSPAPVSGVRGRVVLSSKFEHR
jgi:hypothetical protein